MPQSKQNLIKSLLSKIADGKSLPSLLKTPPRGVLESMHAQPDKGMEDAERALKKLEQAVPLSEDEQVALEAIVLPTERPVTFINNGHFNNLPDPWTHLGQAGVKSRIESTFSAIGRVELPSNPRIPYLGTGFVVGPNLLMTNRHVAELFSTGLGVTDLAFRSGATSAVDFLREQDNPDEDNSAFFSIRKVVMIHPFWDAALLLVDGLPSTIKPLKLSIKSPEDLLGNEIAVVGYPARDDRNALDVQDRIFDRTYLVKRLQPGKIRAREKIRSFETLVNAMTHDSSTLGGNSGSAMIHIATGEVVGLHFAGVYLKNNYAVPTFELARDQRVVDAGLNFTGSVPATSEFDSAWQRTESTEKSLLVKPIKPVSPPKPSPVASDARNQTIRVLVPIDITVKVGDIQTITVTATPSPNSPSGTPLDAAREALAGRPGVVSVEMGYRFKNGWITNERVIVVEVSEKLTPAELSASAKESFPTDFGGIGVDVRVAAFSDQLKTLGIDLSTLERVPSSGEYQEPPNLVLAAVNERMKAIFHVSPDSGFPNLKAFLGRVRSHLTATIYEWDVNHISDALAAAITGRRKLKMVTQKKGTVDAVEDMQTRLGTKFQHVFASVGAGLLFPTAYHIKVASRDGEEFWLSSGNWKDSNQADIDPVGDHETSFQPLRLHNREWHAIIANPTLATLFQKYIEFDFDEANRVPLESVPQVELPDLFIPEASFDISERAAVAQYFEPLVLDKKLEIQPLLTPDRDSSGHRLFLKQATEMVNKGTTSVYVQNQSFNLLAENVPEFEEFMTAVKDKQASGVDVRIILRDSREFGRASGAQQQKLLERLKDFGFNTDLIKLQKKCHTKGIIVDSAEVLLGSENLTNEGALFNRDASLLVRDAEVAQYFEKIFLFDWDNVATQESDETVRGIRIAPPEHVTPIGFRRVSAAEWLGQS